MRVLLAEDDPIVRLIVVEALSDIGATVLEAADAAEALQHFESGPPIDILVTDIRMPGMSGWELARQVRRVQPDVPVIYATGYSETMEAPVSRSMLLHKPFLLAHLAAAVRALTGISDDRSQSDSPPAGL